MMEGDNFNDRLNKFILNRIRKVQNESNSVDFAENIGVPEPPIVAERISDDNYLSVVQEIYDIAAVSGKFDLKFFKNPSWNEDVWETIISRCLQSFDIFKESDRIVWCLKPGKRHEVLNALIEKDKLYLILRERLPQTDLAGDFLRKIIRGDNLLNSLHNPNSKFIKALEWLQNLYLPSIPELPKVRSVYKFQKLLEDQDVLLKNGFVGRKIELKKLNRFLESNVEGVDTSLYINGIGGAGKSTLIAKFCANVLIGRKAYLVVLDFDKPGIDAMETALLQAELIRQIGNQLPEEYEQVNLLRKKIREDISSTKVYDLEKEPKTSDTATRLEMSGLFDLSRLLIKLGGEHIPILIILDTFEEVIQRDLSASISTWILKVEEYISPIKLKVIYSGRNIDDISSRTNQGQNSELIILDEFDAAMTREYLKALNVPEQYATQIIKSKFLPKRPLEIKLLATALNDDPTLTIQELETEIKKGGGKNSNLFTGLIYKRVLLRIKDEKVRMLAFPGLIMRYLDIQVIQNVLTPALRIESMDLREAERILSALSVYNWLSYKNKIGQIWHRKELRISMLKLMIAKDIVIAKKIHQNAIDFFSNGNSIEDAVEVFYHRLMLANIEDYPVEFSQKEAKEYWPYLQVSLNDFNDKVKTTFRFMAKGIISPSDLKFLPDYLQDKARNLLGKQLNARGNYKKSKEIFLNSFQNRYRVGQYNNYFVAEPWELTTMFNTGMFDMLRAVQYNEREYSNPRYLIDMCYLDCLGWIDLNQYRSMALENMSQLLGNLRSLPRKLNLVINEDFLQKLIFCKMCVERDHTDRYMFAVDDIIKEIAESKRVQSIGSITKFLVSATKNDSQPNGMTFEPPLDHRWLHRFRELSPSFDNHQSIMFDNIVNINGHNFNELRRKLNEVYYSGELWYFDEILMKTAVGNELLYELVTGSYPEFREPLKHIILKILNERHHEISVRGQLIDLLPESIFRSEINDRYALSDKLFSEQSITNLIEILDKYWLIPDLIDSLIRNFGNESLFMIREAIDSKKQNLRILIAKLGRT